MSKHRLCSACNVDLTKLEGFMPVIRTETRTITLCPNCWEHFCMTADTDLVEMLMHSLRGISSE